MGLSCRDPWDRPLMSRSTRPRAATVPSVTTGSLAAIGLRGRRKVPSPQVTGRLDDAHGADACCTRIENVALHGPAL